MRRPPNNLKCELLQLIFCSWDLCPPGSGFRVRSRSWIRIPDPGPGLGPPAWLDTDPVRSRIRIWIRTRSSFYRYPLYLWDPLWGPGFGSGPMSWCWVWIRIRWPYMVRIWPRAGARSGSVPGSGSERWGGRGKVNNDTILSELKMLVLCVMYAPA
jgi:hypothetical protein